MLSIHYHCIGVSLVLHMIIFYPLATWKSPPDLEEAKNHASVRWIFKAPTAPALGPPMAKVPTKKRVRSLKGLSQPRPVKSQGLPEAGSLNHLQAKSGEAELSSSNRPKPLLLNGGSVQIPYPSRARLLKVEGRVRLRLTILESGEVEKAEVVSGPAFGLPQAALMLAKKLLFLPATDEYGNALVSEVEHEVIFKLKDAPH